jgi:hypothetical protein
MPTDSAGQSQLLMHGVSNYLKVCSRSFTTGGMRVRAGEAKAHQRGRLYATIPHIVDGTNWKTTITLVNLDTATRKYRLVLRADNGALKSFSFLGRNAGNTFNGEIPRGGIAVFETPGTNADLNSGSAELDTLGTDSQVGIHAVFGTTGITGRISRQRCRAALTSSTTASSRTTMRADSSPQSRC